MREPKFFRRFDYNRDRLPNSFLASMDRVETIDEARNCSGLSIGYPGWALLYYLVLSTIDPEQETLVIETGTNFGASTIVLAQALSDSGAHGHVHTIEIDEQTHEKAKSQFAQSGVGDRITAHLGDAKAALPSVLDSIPQVDVAFLDGCHLLDDVVAEFRAVRAKLTPKSLVIFDNTYLIAEPHEDQRVHGALGAIVDEFGGNVVNFPSVSWYTPGMAIWQSQPFDMWPPPIRKSQL